MPDIIKVVGGLIINKGSILIAQRNKNQTHPLKWEFPGGKVRIDEEVKSALEREIKEELSLKIQNPILILDYFFSYPENNKNIHLFFYKIDEFNGKILKNIHNDIRWVRTKELKLYDFLAGDRKIIDYIINNDIKF